jgi:hypothetical protein
MKAQDAVSFNTDKVVRKPSLDYGDRGDFNPSEFNLYEVGIIEDVESYVRQAFQKKAALMFKEGEEFTGKNKETIRYVKRRIHQIEKATNIPFRSLLRETGYYLISRSNFFWVIVRDKDMSGGRVVDGKQPIAGFFPLAPETVEIKKNRETGKIERYRQLMPDGRIKEYSPKDIIHFKAYSKTGFNFGTPTLLSVKDDIRALRRIEENVELLIYQNLFPIFHYKVGTEVKPAGEIRLDSGQVVNEVDFVRMTIANMPSEGGIVTPERHEIKFIGGEGKALRAEGYMDYYKKRVFAGLGASAVDFGEGETANRATADNMSRILVDSVKDYQDILSEQFTHHVINPLLRESNFNLDFFDEENVVTFNFREIDIETQLKKNVNSQLLYNGNMIDINESRKMTGQEPITSDQEKGMFSRRVTIPEMKIKTKSQEFITEMTIEGQKQATEMNAAMNAEVKAGTTTTRTSKSATGGTSKSVTKVAKAVGGRIKAMSAPTNQFGTKTGPQKTKKDSFNELDSLATRRWNELKLDVLRHLKEDEVDINWINTVIGIALNDMRDRYISIVEREIFKGFRDFKIVPTHESLGMGKQFFVIKLNGYINALTETLSKQVNAELVKIFNRISKETLAVNITEIFDKMEFRLKFFDTTERLRANNIGRALALKQSGFLVARIDKNKECEQCVDTDSVLDLEFLVHDDVPPSHSNCTCKVVLSDFTKKEERCILRVKRQLRAKNPSWTKQRVTSAAIAICRASIGNGK